MRASVVLLLSALLAFAPFYAHGATDSIDPTTVVALDAYISSTVGYGFSGEVLLADRGRVVLRKAYGFADREARRPFTNETPTGIASASKQFTAAAILRLQDQRKLSVNDTLDKFFPDVPSDKAKITLLQVITHTSGLRGGFENDFTGSDDMSIVKELFAKPLFAPPGAQFRYSTEAYALLGAVIARASGMSYHEFLRKALFVPARMTHTGFWSDDATAPAAHAYVGWKDMGDASRWPRSWRVNGGGDVLTTASDLFAWEVALRSGKVLSPAALKAYFSPLVSVGRFRPGAQYGYGLFFERTNHNTLEIEHGGDTERGYNAAFSRFPDDGIVEIILSNSYTARGSSLRTLVQPEIEAALLDRKLPSVRVGMMLQPESLAHYAGTYISSHGEMQLLSDGAYLWATLSGQNLVNESMHYDSGVVASLARANEQTDALLTHLLSGDTNYYAAVLDHDANGSTNDFIAEWNRLTEKHGPLVGYKILGSRVSVNVTASGATLGNQAVTGIVLEMRDSRATISYFWLGRGNGKLTDSDPFLEPSPFVGIVGELTTGKYQACDWTRNICVSVNNHLGSRQLTNWRPR